MEKARGCRGELVVVLILTPRLKSYINLGKILGPSVPWFFSSVKGYISTYLLSGRIKPDNLCQWFLTLTAC